MCEADNQELYDVIPIDAFDNNPIEPYEPRYGPERVQAMLTKGK
jgi:hypothetical protein